MPPAPRHAAAGAPFPCVDEEDPHDALDAHLLPCLSLLLPLLSPVRPNPKSSYLTAAEPPASPSNRRRPVARRARISCLTAPPRRPRHPHARDWLGEHWFVAAIRTTSSPSAAAVTHAAVSGRLSSSWCRQELRLLLLCVRTRNRSRSCQGHRRLRRLRSPGTRQGRRLRRTHSFMQGLHSFNY